MKKKEFLKIVVLVENYLGHDIDGELAEEFVLNEYGYYLLEENVITDTFKSVILKIDAMFKKVIKKVPRKWRGFVNTLYGYIKKLTKFVAYAAVILGGFVLTRLLLLALTGSKSIESLIAGLSESSNPGLIKKGLDYLLKFISGVKNFVGEITLKIMKKQYKIEGKDIKNIVDLGKGVADVSVVASKLNETIDKNQTFNKITEEDSILVIRSKIKALKKEAERTGKDISKYLKDLDNKTTMLEKEDKK